MVTIENSATATTDRRGRTVTMLLGVVTALSLMLSGCAGDCNDPRFDGLGCAVSDPFTGNYKKQTAELERQAAESQTRAAALRTENEQLNARMAKLNREERSAARRLRNSNEKLAGLITKLSKARAEKKKSAEEYKRLDAQLKALETRHKAVSRGPMTAKVRAEIKSLEQDVQRLQGILDTG